MIFEKRQFLISKNQTINLDDDYEILGQDVYSNSLGLKRVSQIHLDGELVFDQYSDLVNVDLIGYGEAIVECALTFKELKQEFKFDVADEIYFMNNKIDLKPLIIMSILNSIDGVLFDPSVNHKISGDGWSFGENDEVVADEIDERLVKLKDLLNKME